MNTSANGIHIDDRTLDDQVARCERHWGENWLNSIAPVLRPAYLQPSNATRGFCKRNALALAVGSQVRRARRAR